MVRLKFRQAIEDRMKSIGKRIDVDGRSPLSRFRAPFLRRRCHCKNMDSANRAESSKVSSKVDSLLITLSRRPIVHRLSLLSQALHNFPIELRVRAPVLGGHNVAVPNRLALAHISSPGQFDFMADILI